MKLSLIVIATLSLISTTVFATECKVYLSVHRQKERAAALEVQSFFKNTLEVEIINSIEIPLFQTVEDNSNSLLQKSSTIIVLNEETDMTGSEIQVEIFKTDDLGKVSFAGGQMVPARLKKTRKLIELTKAAVSFSCEVNSSL